MKQKHDSKKSDTAREQTPRKSRSETKSSGGARDQHTPHEAKVEEDMILRR